MRSKTKEEHLGRLVCDLMIRNGDQDMNAEALYIMEIAANGLANYDQELRLCAEQSSTRIYAIERDRDAAIKERDAAQARVAELERELKNAREAHGIAEQKVDEMLHPKVEAKPAAEAPKPADKYFECGPSTDDLFEDPGPPAAEAPAEVAEGEGPYYDVYKTDVRENGKLVACCGFRDDAERLVRRLNLGTRAEKLQALADALQVTVNELRHERDEWKSEAGLRAANEEHHKRKAEALQARVAEMESERDKWKSDAGLRAVNEEHHKRKADAAEAREKKASDELLSERRRMGNIAEAVDMAEEYDAVDDAKFHGRLVRRLIHLSGAEAREKALRELVQRWCYESKKYAWNVVPLRALEDILAGREPNQPADQAPEVKIEPGQTWSGPRRTECVLNRSPKADGVAEMSFFSEPIHDGVIFEPRWVKESSFLEIIQACNLTLVNPDQAPEVTKP